MRVNWFFPLADAEEYSHRLLPVLRSRAEVVLWTTAPAWADFNQADVTVYPAASAEMNRLHPGIVVVPGENVPDLRHALAAVVHERDVFERLKAANRLPLLHAPWPGDSVERYAEMLLQFAAEAPRFVAVRTARDLTDLVASELSIWLEPSTATPWLRQVAQEIQAISAGSDNGATPAKALAA